MYIDLKNYSPEKIQKYLDSLTEDDIKKMQNNIIQKREQVLRSVSPKVYYEAVKSIISN